MEPQISSKQIIHSTLPRPSVGVGVLVIQNNKILLGKRMNAHGAGTWAPAGGHLEFGESVEDCAKRELLEEVGVVATKIQRGDWVNTVFYDEMKHYVSIFMIVTAFDGEVKLMEPNRCECWKWFSLNELPQPLFRPLESIVRNNSLLL